MFRAFQFLVKKKSIIQSLWAVFYFYKAFWTFLTLKTEEKLTMLCN